MAKHKPVVVIGLLGTTLDRGQGSDRWEHWRPSVALCQQDDLVVSRFELQHAASHADLAATVRDDARAPSGAE